MHLMSPRCNDKGNIKELPFSKSDVFFLFLHYLLLHENSLIILGSISWHSAFSVSFCRCCPRLPFCYSQLPFISKGSPRLYNWLLNHRHFGPYIRNFRENKSNSARAKVISLVLMWGTMLYCIFFLIPLLWVKIPLGVDCRRGHLSYSLFQDIKIVGKSLTGICQFIFPMFYGVLPNNIGYIFYGDKRNFLWHGRQMLVHRLPYLLRLR